MRSFKKIFIIFITTIIIVMITSSVNVKADIGPKSTVNVEVVGTDGVKYTITLIAQKARGPNKTYDEWDESEDQKYHEIMEYQDSEGYKWVGFHQELIGDGHFKWGYMPPTDFKILILTEDGKYYSSKAFTRTAFNSYYKVDFKTFIFNEVINQGIIDEVKNNYKYGPEILSFFLRLIMTIGIEIAIALLFSYRSKRHITIILIVNIITQLFLNVGINLISYYQGILLALLFYVIAEIFIAIFEATFYSTMFSREGSLKAFSYGLIANIVSFGIGFGILSLIEGARIAI